MKEFNIGDRVRVREFKDLPKEMQTKGISRISGQDGAIIDKMWSGAKGCTVYRLHLDGYSVHSRVDFLDGSFDLISELEKATYEYEFEFAENLVIARLYEVKTDSRKMIARGHGHIFHDGALGIAQASSYALKRIYKFLEDGDAED